ncbi:hypothetical protein D9M70_329740 [compost metagenome]
MPTGLTVLAFWSPVPRPRIHQRGRPWPSVVPAEALGMNWVTSLADCSEASRILSPLSTEIEEGTSCTVSSRFCAVTVTLARVGALPVVSSPAGASSALVTAAAGSAA